MNKASITVLIGHKQISWVWLILVSLGYSPLVWSAADPSDLLQPFVSESLTYDSNLYRISPIGQLGPQLKMDDFINSASVGGRIHKALGRQIFDLDLQLADNRFVANKLLNNVSTKDSAVWNWQAGHNWSGKLGADYGKSLAGFANSQFFALDMLDTTVYNFDLRYQVNSNWRLDSGLRRIATTHSAVSRQNQNIEAQTASAGVTFLTSSNNSAGLEYSHTEAQFPSRQLSFGVGAIDIAYQENLARVLFKYDYSPKLHLEGQAGYLIHSNPNVSARDYQGNIWRVSTNWMPTVKTLVAVAAWHELTSYAELASNFYVSEGVSISPSWNVTNKIMLSGQARMESQDHSGLRQDNLFSSQVSASYMPARFADLNLAYQFYQRDSNRQLFSYVGDSVTATVRLKF